MKLSDNTIAIIKNFSEINTNILIKPGKELSTISTMRNIFAKASIEETFDTEFGIYDLNEFLAVLSSMKNPVMSFQDKLMTITPEGRKKGTRYFYSDPSVIVAPSKEVNMPEAEVTFSLSKDNLEELKRMASTLKTPDLALIGEKGGDIDLRVCDKKNDTGNTHDIPVGEGATGDYTFYFKVENLKMISGDYDVSVSSKSISHFKHKKLPIEYWIALEPDSTISK